MNDYKVSKIGDVVFLPVGIGAEGQPTIQPGAYVILSVGDVCTLAVATEAPGDPERRPRASSTHVQVPAADLCRFLPTDMSVDPL